MALLVKRKQEYVSNYIIYFCYKYKYIYHNKFIDKYDLCLNLVSYFQCFFRSLIDWML